MYKVSRVGAHQQPSTGRAGVPTAPIPSPCPPHYQTNRPTSCHQSTQSFCPVPTLGFRDSSSLAQQHGFTAWFGTSGRYSAHKHFVATQHLGISQHLRASVSALWCLTVQSHPHPCTTLCVCLILVVIGTSEGHISAPRSRASTSTSCS